MSPTSLKGTLQGPYLPALGMLVAFSGSGGVPPYTAGLKRAPAASYGAYRGLENFLNKIVVWSLAKPDFRLY